jgi:hypothetical protein
MLIAKQVTNVADGMESTEAAEELGLVNLAFTRGSSGLGDLGHLDKGGR